MAKELADWILKDPSFTVALAIALFALVLAVLGLVLAHWLKPKLTEFDTLRNLVSGLQTSASRGATAADGLADAKTSIAVVAASLAELKAMG